MRPRHCPFFAFVMTASTWMLLSSAAAQGRHFDERYDFSGQVLVTKGNVERVLLSVRGDFSVTIDSTWGLATIPYFIYGEVNGKLRERDLRTENFAFLFPHNTFYGFALVIYEFSRLRQIDYRWLPGGGVGLYLLRTPEHTLSITAALLYEFTAFSTEVSNKTWRLSNRIKGAHQLFNRSLIISYENFLKPSLTDAGDYRWIATVTLGIPLSDYFSLRSTLENSFESVVLPGRAKNDFRWTFGFGISN